VCASIVLAVGPSSTLFEHCAQTQRMWLSPQRRRSAIGDVGGPGGSTPHARLLTCRGLQGFEGLCFTTASVPAQAPTEAFPAEQATLLARVYHLAGVSAELLRSELAVSFSFRFACFGLELCLVGFDESFGQKI